MKSETGLERALGKGALAAFLLALLLGPPGVPAEEAPAAGVQFPGYTIDLKQREVRMQAEVCCTSGILEYLVCLPGTFEHESIFVTTCRPELLHAALLLIGLEPHPPSGPDPEAWWQEGAARKASHVRLEVVWQEGEKTHRKDMAALLVNREAKGAEDGPDTWLFVGSFFHRAGAREIYAARIEGVVVGIWFQPSCVIQYGRKTGNPYRGTDLGMAVRETAVPPRGTRVELIFSPRLPPAGTKPPAAR